MASMVESSEEKHAWWTLPREQAIFAAMIGGACQHAIRADFDQLRGSEIRRSCRAGSDGEAASVERFDDARRNRRFRDEIARQVTAPARRGHGLREVELS